MSTNQIAFYIGLFGSVHCIAMCGPLAFSVPVKQPGWWWLLANKLLYNTGRIFSYTILGLIVGLLGRQLWMLGLQQAISLISGVLIIIAGFSRLFKFKLMRSRAAAKLLSPITHLLNYALNHRAGHFVIGVLNGFLPCGFVYLALVGALNTNGPVNATQYMFWFGVGTFPLMLIATVSSGFVSTLVRRRIKRAMPYLMLCLGFWFVVRGLDLSIPYISPTKPTTGVATCH